MSTLCDWKNKFSELSEVLKENKDIASLKVKNTLFQAATEGFETVEEVQEIRNGQKYVKRIKKQVPPSISAMIFYLKNRAGWQDNPPQAKEADNSIKLEMNWKRDE
jgi:hypothetical protein